MMSHPLPQKILHRIFRLGIWVKGFDAVLEIIGGLFFLLASNITLNRLVIALTEHELIEDPQDRIAVTLHQAIAHITPDTRIFGSAYLIGHGLIKLCVVTGLLLGKRWAYPAALAFLCLFIGYQLYHISYHYSLPLVILTFFDSIFVFSIWYEYRLLTRPPGGAKDH